MPIHDWTKVIAGIFHDFHHEWISTMKRALNGGLLPSEYYALAEQVAGGPIPDGIATAASEADLLALRKNRIAIRHTSDHRVVAMIEIVSPGNKSSRHALRTFVEKTIEFLAEGIHLLVIDLFPPGRRDPQGIHAAIWSEIEDDGFQLPADKPLTVAAYAAGPLKRAFIEPVAVGVELPEMPLFLETERYVLAPLESSYQAAWDGVPAYWQKQLG